MIEEPPTANAGGKCSTAEIELVRVVISHASLSLVVFLSVGVLDDSFHIRSSLSRNWERTKYVASNRAWLRSIHYTDCRRVYEITGKHALLLARFISSKLYVCNQSRWFQFSCQVVMRQLNMYNCCVNIVRVSEIPCMRYALWIVDVFVSQYSTWLIAVEGRGGVLQATNNCIFTEISLTATVLIGLHFCTG